MQHNAKPNNFFYAVSTMAQRKKRKPAKQQTYMLVRQAKVQRRGGVTGKAGGAGAAEARGEPAARPLCKCHGVPMWRNGNGLRCSVARKKIYAKYLSTTAGIEAVRRKNARQIRCGDNYFGMARTAALATQIRRQIKRKLKADVPNSRRGRSVQQAQ